MVDTTLLHLLWTLDQLDILKVLLSDTDGTTCDIKELSDGLPGELYGDRGWIKRFRRNRIHDFTSAAFIGLATFRTTPTKAQLLERATEIDSIFGSTFMSPVGGE